VTAVLNLLLLGCFLRSHPLTVGDYRRLISANAANSSVLNIRPWHIGVQYHHRRAVYYIWR
jgi:hypothetical protein